MSIPTQTTEIALPSQPAAATPTWTDVSGYVLEIHTDGGRINPLDIVEAGTAKYLFDNRDRRFEPLFTSGAYNPNVKLLRRIRSYAAENPIVDANFEKKNVGTPWDPIGAGDTITIPVFGGVTGAGPKYGDWAGLVTVNGAAPTRGVFQDTIIPLSPIKNAESWVFSIYVMGDASSSGKNVRVNLIQQGGGTGAATSSSSAVALTNGTWQRIEIALTTNAADRTNFRVEVEIRTGGGTWAATNKFFVDAAQLTRGVAASIPWSETIYIFDGYIEAYPQKWAGGMTATVELEAVDGHKPLAPMALPRGKWDLVVLDDAPQWFFRLGEVDGADKAVNTAAPNIQDGDYTGTGSLKLAQAPGGTVVGETDFRVWWDGKGSANNPGVEKNIKIPGLQFAMECLVEFDPRDGTGLDAQFMILDHGVILLFLDDHTAGGDIPYTGKYLHLWMNMSDGASTNTQFIVANPGNVAGFWDNAEHLIQVYWDGTNGDARGGWPQIYIDGDPMDPDSAANVALTQAVYSNSPEGSMSKLFESGTTGLFSIGHIGTEAGTWNWSGYIDEVAYWTDALPLMESGDEWASSRWAQRLYGAAEEDTGTRIGHLLDQAALAGGLNPWPASRRNLQVGNSTLIPVRYDEENILDEIRKAAKSELGLFYYGLDGKATFINRQYILTYPTNSVRAILSDRPDSTTKFPMDNLGSGGLDFDDRDIYNDIRVSRFQAGYGDASHQQVATDTASQDEYLIKSLTLDDSLVNNDGEAANAAELVLFLLKDPFFKAQTVTIFPLEDEINLWRIISQIRLNDRIRVERTPPPGTGTALSVDCLIMKVQHDMVYGEWAVTYTISNAPDPEWWVACGTTTDEYSANAALGQTTRVGN